MPHPDLQCLILSCGNTLRSDDGVGPFLSEWARQRFSGNEHIAILTRHQWTPDLAEDLSTAATALFIDCSIEAAPGEVLVRPVEPAPPVAGLATHHSGAPELLSLSRELFAAAPARALLLTIGAGSTDLGETFSPAVQAAIPKAQKQLEEAVSSLLDEFLKSL
ncbi:MAG: hydrogenase maturation protease [Terracidiphilus sp.]|nr:hydrogenase maturation protease [Terracidiphilus sp.]